MIIKHDLVRQLTDNSSNTAQLAEHYPSQNGGDRLVLTQRPLSPRHTGQPTYPLVVGDITQVDTNVLYQKIQGRAPQNVGQTSTKTSVPTPTTATATATASAASSTRATAITSTITITSKTASGSGTTGRATATTSSAAATNSTAADQNWFSSPATSSLSWWQLLAVCFAAFLVVLLIVLSWVRHRKNKKKEKKRMKDLELEEGRKIREATERRHEVERGMMMGMGMRGGGDHASRPARKHYDSRRRSNDWSSSEEEEESSEESYDDASDGGTIYRRRRRRRGAGDRKKGRGARRPRRRDRGGGRERDRWDRDMSEESESDLESVDLSPSPGRRRSPRPDHRQRHKHDRRDQKERTSGRSKPRTQYPDDQSQASNDSSLPLGLGPPSHSGSGPRQKTAKTPATFRDSIFSSYPSMRQAALQLKMIQSKVKLKKQIEAEERIEQHRRQKIRAANMVRDREGDHGHKNEDSLTPQWLSSSQVSSLNGQAQTPKSILSNPSVPPTKYNGRKHHAEQPQSIRLPYDTHRNTSQPGATTRAQGHVSHDQAVRSLPSQPARKDTSDTTDISDWLPKSQIPKPPPVTAARKASTNSVYMTVNHPKDRPIIPKAQLAPAPQPKVKQSRAPDSNRVGPLRTPIGGTGQLALPHEGGIIRSTVHVSEPGTGQVPGKKWANRLRERR